jgi:prophage DNA circulation protein
VHEYPNRDDVWVEDLGRQGQRIQVSGFLVENAAYGGGAVIAQRTRLIAACEKAGPDDLVHPSLGRVKVTLTEFEISEVADKGGAFGVRFTFIQGGPQEFPTSRIATQQQTQLSGVAAYAALAQDFVNQVSGLISLPPVVGEIGRTAAALQTSVAAIAGRATSLVAMMANLPGAFGRYVGQYSAQIKSPLTTVQALIGAGAKSNQAVTAAAASLTVAAAAANPTAIAAAAQATIQALQAANPEPMTAIRALLELQGDMTTRQQTTSSLTKANAAAISLYRGAAVTAAALTTASIKLASSDDAAVIQSLICAALDVEIQTAGDAGLDASYLSLRALRVAVVQDLRARAATLAVTQLVATPRPVPLLVMAQRLYQDAGRYDELLQEALPIHPAFPPTQYRALSQ